MDTTHSIQVALRIRSVNEQDQPHCSTLNNEDCLELTGNTIRVVPHNKVFAFDHVFGPTTTQKDLFTVLGEDLVHKFVKGSNVTVLAYGQTSSGKTYTMGTALSNGRCNKTDDGIIPRAMTYLFDALNQQTTPSSMTLESFKVQPSHILSSTAAHGASTTELPSVNYAVKVSFIEIHNEQLNDLLNEAPMADRPQLSIREDAKGRIHWTGAKELDVHNVDDVLYHLEQGTKHRTTGATSMNDKSSRSHAIFSVTLQQASSTDNAAAGQPSSCNSITISKFHFVDLAGSERLKRTATEGDRRKEGISINAGLHALGNVLSALGDQTRRDKHVPYRDSKLTRLLRDSLGGNAATVMIACASPLQLDVVETLNTLQFANRARNIKHRSENFQEWKPTVNVKLLRFLASRLGHQAGFLKSTNSVMPMDACLPVTHEEKGTEKSLEIELPHKLDLDAEQFTKDYYDQTIARLKSKLEDSTQTLENLHEKYRHLQHSFDDQASAMSQLQLQLNKTLDREHNNIAYIDKLETKLTNITSESTRDRTTLDEQKNMMAKLKEDGKTTELYIQGLEQQLAKGEEDHQRLSNAMERLKRQTQEKDDKIMDLHQQLHTAYENGFSQQQSLSAQIDNLGEKCLMLEKDRDEWKDQAQEQFELTRALEMNDHNTSMHLDDGDPSTDHSTDEYLQELGNKHKQVIDQLDSVLQDYSDTIDQLDELEHMSVLESTPSLMSSSKVDEWDDQQQSGQTTPTDLPRGGYLNHEIGRALDHEDRCKIATLETKVNFLQEQLDPAWQRLELLMDWKEEFTMQNKTAMDRLEKNQKEYKPLLSSLYRRTLANHMTHNPLLQRMTSDPSNQNTTAWDLLMALNDKNKTIQAQAARIHQLEQHLSHALNTPPLEY